MESSRMTHARIGQNFHLVWLDKNIDETNDKWRNSILQLHKAINTITTFVDVDLCIDFITDSQETTFMIISEEFSQILLPIVLDIAQVSNVYILCDNQSQCEKLLKNCPQVSGVHTDVALICEALEHVIQDHDHNMIPISVVKKTNDVTNDNLDKLNCSFMYTRILKDILLTLEFHQEHFREFLAYCREQLATNPVELNNVNKIEREYDGRQAIRWYTYQCFLYPMLNRALRMMEGDLIVNMGFFIRDLHKHIIALHTEQYKERDSSKSFIVYRGQGLSQADLDQLKTTLDGLLAFNNFLSTSLNREVSLKFARRTIRQTSLVGILFVLKIDPSIATTPFANIKDVSCYKREEEILFSMHSIFRIGPVEKIENNDRLWQVNLTLTSDTDPQLQILAKSIESDIEGVTGWFRLSSLLVKVAEFDKAYQLYDAMLKQSTDEKEKGHIYHQVGSIKQDQGKNTDALEYYQKALEIREKTLPANHPDLALSYNNIGTVHRSFGEYTKALLYCEKSLKILRKIRPENHSDLATSYSNIGEVYRNIGDYSTAVSYGNKALEICRKTLPSNHPDLASSCNNIAGLYENMGEYSKALSYYEEALRIVEKALPSKHPGLGISYNNVAGMYDNMGEYSKALLYYEKAFEVFQKAVPSEHPCLATLYNNIGGMYQNMGDYINTLSYFEKALEIRRKTLPLNHPDLAASYNNIGKLYQDIGEYLEALAYYQTAVEMQRKTLPTNHPDLATSYCNIGMTYYNMNECPKALSYCENALEIRRKAFPANHPILTLSYNNIGAMYHKMNKWSEALSYYEKALEIQGKTLSTNHIDLAASYNNIGALYRNMGEYSKALAFYEKALAVFENSPNHPNAAISYSNIGLVHQCMSEYSKALLYYERAYEISKQSLPHNHRQLEKIKKNVDFIKERL